MRGSSAARPWAAPIYLLAGTSPMHPPTEPRLPLCRPCDEAVTTHATPRLHPPRPEPKKDRCILCGRLWHAAQDHTSPAPVLPLPNIRAVGLKGLEGWGWVATLAPFPFFSHSQSAALAVLPASKLRPAMPETTIPLALSRYLSRCEK